jgi:hypothetical protein
MTDREIFLGDGLFASFDGFALTLRAPREYGDYYVVLEPFVLEAFLEFAQRCGAGTPVLPAHLSLYHTHCFSSKRYSPITVFLLKTHGPSLRTGFESA